MNRKLKKVLDAHIEEVQSSYKIRVFRRREDGGYRTYVERDGYFADIHAFNECKNVVEKNNTGRLGKWVGRCFGQPIAYEETDRIDFELWFHFKIKGYRWRVSLYTSDGGITLPDKWPASGSAAYIIELLNGLPKVTLFSYLSELDEHRESHVAPRLTNLTGSELFN